MTVDQSKIDRLSQRVNAILEDSIDRSETQSFTNGVVAGVTDSQKTIYLEARGIENIETEKPMKKDSLFNIYSCTKAVTTTAILQLWENGLIDLDVPVKNYLPKIGKVDIIKGFKADKSPILEHSEVEITMRMLLTHTAGFGYAFYSKEYHDSLELHGQPSFPNVNENSMDYTYLLFEPGFKWHYGMNIDWAGFVLESITGKKLGEYIKQNIFKPVNMKNSTFEIGPNADVVPLHQRTKTGLNISPKQPDRTPILHMGGHGLVSCVEDYLKFIRVWLNGGKTDEGIQIISPQTFQHAIKNNLPDGLHITSLESYDPSVTDLVMLDPSLNPDTWALGFARSENDMPSGRPKGSLYWCGVANLYFWVDIKNKIGGYWATLIFPFGDPSSNSYHRFEKVVYDILV